MERFTHEIIIGVVGSVVGAFLVYVGSYGLKLTSTARKRLREERLAEQQTWSEGDPSVRQNITNYYLFTVLKHLFLANLFWVAGEIGSYQLSTQLDSATIYNYLNTGFGALSLIFFYLGLGTTLRFIKLTRLGKP